MIWFGGGEPKQVTELRRLFTTFGFLVAKLGATAGIGLAYWAVATRLFPAADIGLAAAAASTALLLASAGGLGIPLLILAELERSTLRSVAPSSLLAWPSLEWSF